MICKCNLNRGNRNKCRPTLSGGNLLESSYWEEHENGMIILE
jgi:hypothetical protein